MDGFDGIGSLKGISTLQQFRYMLQAIRDVRSGKAGQEDAVERTILRYKLDMDERGVLKSASASDSIRAVTNQEQTNVRRLSADARNRGEDVVAVDVDYETKIVDGKLAITAGHTEVVSRPLAGAAEQPGDTFAARDPGVDAAGRDRSADEYQRIGKANRDAAASGLLVDLLDDGTLRGLSEGLEPE